MCTDVGNGGCGKSHVIHAINTTLHGLGKKILLTSLTGLTANNISGRTIHSTVNLPFGGGYRVLPSSSLQRLQAKFSNAVGLVIDEFSMLQCDQFWIIDKRLQQIMCNEKPFGGLCVLLAGDPGQLPPIKGDALWSVPKIPRGGVTPAFTKSLGGHNLFNDIEDVIHLKQNLRLDGSDAEANLFDSFLKRLRNGDLIPDDFELVRSNCCEHFTGATNLIEEALMILTI